MSIIDHTRRWLAAAGFTLAPLCLFVLPPILFPTANYTTAEAQFQAIAQAGTGHYTPFLIQLIGAVLWMPAVSGVMRLLRERGRGTVLGYLGGALGLVASLALLVAIGVELAQVYVLVNGGDKAAMVQLALALNTWSVFGMFLMTGLLGFFLSLLLLALALLRAKVLPWQVLGLALAPVVLAFLPMPDAVANLVSPALMVVPCVWISVQLAKGPAPRPSRAEPVEAMPIPGAVT
jgi:hypothetical protein